jgi:hypothetical protein
MPARRKQAALPGVKIKPAAREEGIIKLYPYQDESLTAGVHSLIAAGLSVPADWEPSSRLRSYIGMRARQTGKTYEISTHATIVCCAIRNCACVTLSASLRQGALNIRKDAEVFRTVIDAARRRYGQDSSLPDREKLLITTPLDKDDGTLLDLDAFAEVVEAGKLITKFRWGNTESDYSSHEIWAANPATARGAKARLVNLDEAFTVEEYKETVAAIRRCIDRVPDAQFIQMGTPPIRSSHESWEALYDEAEYTPNPRGNWRWSNAPGGQPTPILRVSAYDAELAGIVYYDEVTGQLSSAAEVLERSSDKETAARELALAFLSSGTAMIPYSCLTRAAAHPQQGGEAFDLGVLSELDGLSDEGLRAALRALIPPVWTQHCSLGDGLGFGHDQSTSDKEGQSNPSALVVIQEAGNLRHTRLVVRWLSRFPRVNEELIRMILGDAMRAGLRLRGMGIDASNEQFHAQRLQRMFGHLLPVQLYKNGEKHPTRDMRWKEHLAGNYAQLFVDSLISLPGRSMGKSTEWILADHSLATKGPSGVEWVTSKGHHADTFASAMLAEEQLSAAAMPVKVDIGGQSGMRDKPGNFDDDDDWPAAAPNLPY